MAAPIETMNKKKQRSWMSRLKLLPQTAEGWMSRQFHRIPQKVRFLLLTALFSALTTFAVSHFPITILPQYQAGDVAQTDLVVPATLLVKDGVQPNPQFKHHPVLLHAGERVTAEHLSLIEAVRRYQLAERDPARLVGLLMLVAFLVFALYKSAITSQSSRLGPRTAFWVASSALMFQALLARAGMFGAAVLSTRPETAALGGFIEFQFAIPFAACALVLGLLVGSQVALAAALMGAVLVAFISPHGLAMGAFALAGSVACVYSAQRYLARNAVTFATSTLAGVNAVMGVASLLIAGQDLNVRRIAGGMLLGAVGAMLVGAMASLAIPIYESVFDILTDLRLLELSNADNPLLRQLAIETPGTSHHSFMVGLLAEEAAKAIGANALLARTACLYHDIGKLAAPKMYIENQKGGPNPHDRVGPLDSVRIITGHVRRGIQMAQDNDLPPQIIDFIPQHHGTRVLAYFYHKAKSQAEARGKTINMDDFRYPGPKPQSKEAVILMLADGAEASVRSLDDQTPENIRGIVKKIVDSVVADGQLDESSITMRELTTIRESLINTLINVYHQRISYPGFNPTAQAANEEERKLANTDLNVAAAISGGKQ